MSLGAPASSRGTSAPPHGSAAPPAGTPAPAVNGAAPAGTAHAAPAATAGHGDRPRPAGTSPAPESRLPWARRVLLPSAAGMALVAFVTVVATGPFVGERDEFSALDGRRLASFPELSLGSLRDGSWMTGVEAWMDDHVAARSRWLTAHGALATRGLAMPVMENVLVDDPQGMQLEKVKKLRVPEDLATHAQRLGQDVRAAGVPILWVYLPRKEEVFADRLPAAWPDNLGATRPRLLDAMAQGGPVLDLTPTLSDPRHRDGYYWRTDHHWTPAGALTALDAIAARAVSLGVTIPQDTRPYTTMTYPDFYGSTGRKVTAGATRSPDRFEIPVPPRWRARSCLGGVCETPTFLEKKARNPERYANRYNAFLGGDYGYQRMVNKDPAATGTVLLLKDSFGDAFSTYLAERVTNLVTIDERHYEGPEIRELVRTLRPDLVVVMHNQVSVLGNVNFDSGVWVDAAGAARERERGAGDG